MVRALTDKEKIGGNGRNLVKVENEHGRFWLRFTYGGKQYAIALELPDSQINCTVAHQKAIQIELDIVADNFDPTLKQPFVYRPNLYFDRAISIKMCRLCPLSFLPESYPTDWKTIVISIE